MRSSRAVRFAAAGVGLALAAAACGSDSATPDSAAGTSGLGSPVKIMVIAPYGTQEANFDEDIAAVKAATVAVNKRNGFGGHEVVVEVCNEKNDAAAAEACGRKAVSEGVIAVVGMFSRIGGISPQLEKAGIPSVSGIGVAKDELTSRSSYFTGAGLLTFVTCPAILNGAGAKTLGMARFDVEASAVTETFSQAGALGSSGAPLALSVKVPPTNADYAPVAAQLSGKGVDGVTLSLTEQASVAMMQAGGKSFRYCHSDAGVSNANLVKLGDIASGYYAASSYASITDNTNPAIKRFNDELDAVAATEPYAAPDKRKSSSLIGWLGVQVLEKVLEGQTGEITGKTVTQLLDKTANLDLGVTVAPLDWTKPGPIPSLERLVNLDQRALKWDPAKGGFADTGKTYNAGVLMAKAQQKR